MTLHIDVAGMIIVNTRIRSMRFPLIERSSLRQVKGLVIHQTDASNAQATFQSYRKAGAKGAHFLIDKDGTVYQTASLLKTTHHVGPIKPRCLMELTCSVKAYAGVRLGAATHRMEMRKSWPTRYPTNEEAVGVELVGRALLPPNFTPPPDKRSANAEQLRAEFGIFEQPTTSQNLALRWLIDELTGSLHIARSEIFRHPVVSWKNRTEAGGATW